MPRPGTAAERQVVGCQLSIPGLLDVEQSEFDRRPSGIDHPSDLRDERRIFGTGKSNENASRCVHDRLTSAARSPETARSSVRRNRTGSDVAVLISESPGHSQH